MASKFVMFYETDMEKLPLARVHGAAHKARLDEFHAKGTLLMAGPFTTPTDGGLAANLTLRSYITANLAQRVIEPTPHIQPAELIVLSPDQPDTLILSEIAA